MKYNLLIPLFFFFNIYSSYSLDPLILNNKQDEYPLGLHLEFFEDTAGLLTIYDISSPEFSKKFKQSEEEILSFGYSKSVYWARFTLDNKSDIEYWLLDNRIRRADYYQIYFKDSTGNWNSKLIADSIPVKNREINHTHFIFKLNLENEQKNTYYIKYISRSGTSFYLTLRSQMAFSEEVGKQFYGYGIYYGILLIMLVYNLMIFFSMRDRGYLYYVIYLLFMLITQFSMDGFSYQYIWTNSPNWSTICIPFFQACGFITLIIFSKRFLQTKKYAPKYNYWLSVLLVLYVFLMLHALFGHLSRSFMITIMMFNLLIPSLLIAGILSWRKKYRPSRYFLFSMIFLLLGFALYASMNAKVLPRNVFTLNSVHFGSVMEVMLLSLALADRFKIMKLEKEEAQKLMIENKTKMLEATSRFVPQQFISYLGKESIVDINLGDSIQEEMTILFSDIRDFTSLSEKMTPKENFEFINSYLVKMEPIIRKNNGFIDKYIGDAIMALFPGSVEDAIKAAIEMQKTLYKYNKEHHNNENDYLRVGIGIHTGNLMLGTIGGELRMDSTVISDAVNLASRMEGLTKIFGCDIIISERSLTKLNKNEFQKRKLGKIQVKGKSQTILAHEIFDADNEEIKSKKIDSCPSFEDGLALYQIGDFQKAKLIFDSIIDKNPRDKTAIMFKKRCEDYIIKGAPANWQGVERLDIK